MKGLKLIYRNSKVLYLLLTPFRFFKRFFSYYIIPDKVALKRKFFKRLGYELNLKNPRNFNEKIQWLKLYDRQDWYHLCADKFCVRDFVSSKLGTDKYLIPLYFETTDYREITTKNIPDKPFVIKCNHDNSSHKIFHSKTDIDWKELRHFYKRRLNAMNFFWPNREFSYKGIKPRVMVEKLLWNHNGEYRLQEFKFHCFHGEVKAICKYQLNNDNTSNYIYLDSDYNDLGPEYNMDVRTKTREIHYSKPSETLRSEMNYIALTLSRDFPYYIRIDIYNVDGALFVGEFTFYDGAGFDRVTPESWNIELGSYMKLSIERQARSI
jgi:hypothetical protein